MNSDIKSLLDNVTHIDAATLNMDAVRRLKRVVRGDDEALGQAYTLLSERLGDKHSQVRYLALLLAGFLFQRSALFRKLLCLDFEQFVQCTMGLDIDYPLPPPSNFAALLREKALELVEAWNLDYGAAFSQLRVGYRYLKEVRKVRFPHLG